MSKKITKENAIKNSIDRGTEEAPFKFKEGELVYKKEFGLDALRVISCIREYHYWFGSTFSNPDRYTTNFCLVDAGFGKIIKVEERELFSKNEKAELLFEVFRELLSQESKEKLKNKLNVAPIFSIIALVLSIISFYLSVSS